MCYTNKGNVHKRFTTLFPECRNIELLKDVGAIPYIMQEKYGYNSEIVLFDNGDDYYYHEKYIPSVKMTYLEKSNNRVWTVLEYLKNESKQIDVLNVYHFGAKDSLLFAYIYKKINPRGFVYLKLDIDDIWKENIKHLDGLKKRVAFFFLKEVDLISAESESMCVEMSRILNREVAYIPNGVFPIYDKIDMKKENIILCVGRLGSKQKNVELLVDAFLALNRKDWKLYLVGEETSEFEIYLERIYREVPSAREKIHHLGMITDKEVLFEVYAISKLFVLPSRWESFGIVMIEALSQKCYVIASDSITAVYDIIDENCGCVFENESKDDLLKILKGITNSYKSEKFYWKKEPQFNWINICAKLNSMIDEKDH